MTNLIYDIHNRDCAKKTLIRLTNVPISIWEKYKKREQDFKCIEELISYVVRAFGHMPSDYRDYDFVFFHITTSADKCSSFQEYGILDLQKSYLCPKTELRRFLDNHNIYIDLEKKKLRYKEENYDITCEGYPIVGTKEHAQCSIGRKFYSDFAICGFLSVREDSSYGGYIHTRPEILYNLDSLLKLRLSEEWKFTHIPYEIIAKTNGQNIIFDNYKSTECGIIEFLKKAYQTSFYTSSEEVVLLKNGISILPADIIEINPLTYWVKK